MNARSSRLALLAAAALVAGGLAGCVVAPVGQPYYGVDTDGDGYADAPPPPPQSEYVGPPPAVGYIWLGGYWSWRVNRYVWIGGRWAAPRPGYHWVPHAWVPYGSRWRHRPGYWSR
jgi:hypothetical protein